MNVSFVVCTIGSVLILLVPSLATASFSGPVVSVLDGDIIEVLHNTHPERVSLSGIDCPEKGQPFGDRAKQAVSALVFGRDVILQTHGQDKYERTLADVFLLDGTHVNHALVKAGWCWWYRKYAPLDTELEKLEMEARKAKKGLWADPAPIPPWAYRKARRGQARNMLEGKLLESENESTICKDKISPVQTAHTTKLIKPRLKFHRIDFILSHMHAECAEGVEACVDLCYIAPMLIERDKRDAAHHRGRGAQCATRCSGIG